MSVLVIIRLYHECWPFRLFQWINPLIKRDRETIINTQALEPNDYSKQGALVVERPYPADDSERSAQKFLLSVEVKSRGENQILTFSRCSI